MSFNIGLSGLNAASKALSVTGNNIANVSSTGFKSSRAEFADMYASSFFGTGKNAVGSGVVTADIAQQFTQGNITGTGNTMDMAISGNGFFVLSNGTSSNNLYTRNGSFTVDSSGYITDSSGNKLQGYGVDVNGNIINGPLTDLQITSDNQQASPTTQLDQTTSLDSSSDIISNTFDPSDADSYNWSTSADIYDSQGNSHTMTQYFAKNSSNEWTMYVTIDGRNPADPSSTEPAAVGLGFDTSGNLVSTSTIASNGIAVGGNPSSASWTAGDISDIEINGQSISLASTANLTAVVSAINSESATTGVEAAVNSDGHLVLSSADGSSFSIGGSNASDLLGSPVDVSNAAKGSVSVDNKTWAAGDLGKVTITYASDGTTPSIGTPTAAITIDLTNVTSSSQLLSSINGANAGITASFDDSGNLKLSSKYGATFTISDVSGSTVQTVQKIMGSITGASALTQDPIAIDSAGTVGDFTLSGWTPAEYDASADSWVANGATASGDGIDINMENTTQTNTSFAVTSLTTDGYTTGLMSGLSVSSDGTLFATYTNGQSQVIGQVAFANFTNAQGLRQVGNSNWAETLDSGQPTVGAPGTGTLGTLASESLEDSNVDLTSELVNLIVEQRNYQANAKTISTENTISQTIIQMS